MKRLIKQLLDGNISRRNFLSRLGAMGVFAVSAEALAQFLAPAGSEDGDEEDEHHPTGIHELHGSGGASLVAQLKAAGCHHIFFSPAVAQVPIYDALIDEPDIHLIQALHEGALVAMANGYAKASGKTPFVLMTRAGFVNAIGQLYNTYKDEVPTLVGVDWGAAGTMGMDGFEDIDDLEEIGHPLTKWHWVAESVARIPDVTRRALKFATSAPPGPVLVGYPKDSLRAQDHSTIIDQDLFSIPMRMRPDPGLIKMAARLLLEASNPLLYVGDEIVQCGAEQEVLELAELLGLPVTQGWRMLAWSKPFPTRHALYLGAYHRNMRYPVAVDVILNLGGRMPYREQVGLPSGELSQIDPRVQLIQVRLDASNLALVYPTKVPIVADVKLATRDLISEIQNLASSARLKDVSERRTRETGKYTEEIRKFRNAVAQERWDRSPISVARLGVEMEQVLEKDTIYVAEPPSGAYMDPFLSFGGNDKQYISHVGGVLGWGVSGAFGVKLAQPDRPVVAVLGDGGFQFMGPQPLWSFARYEAPVIVIVINNRGMNGQRSGAMTTGGKQYQMGLNTGFYLGDPDMDFVKMAGGFGVEGEKVVEAAAFRTALERAKRATVEGRPYVLDVHTERIGLGAASTWHSAYSIAARRNRSV